MPVEHHALGKEFPELRERIHELKQGDTHFARLFSQYETLDKQIVRIEDGLENCADDALAELKHKRVGLKDTLYGLLKG